MHHPPLHNVRDTHAAPLKIHVNTSTLQINDAICSNKIFGLTHFAGMAKVLLSAWVEINWRGWEDMLK